MQGEKTALLQLIPNSEDILIHSGDDVGHTWNSRLSHAHILKKKKLKVKLTLEVYFIWFGRSQHYFYFLG